MFCEKVLLVETSKQMLRSRSHLTWTYQGAERVLQLPQKDWIDGLWYRLHENSQRRYGDEKPDIELMFWKAGERSEVILIPCDNDALLWWLIKASWKFPKCSALIKLRDGVHTFHQMRKTAALQGISFNFTWIQNIIQSNRARGTSQPNHYENSPFDLPMKTLCHISLKNIKGDSCFRLCKALP